MKTKRIRGIFVALIAVLIGTSSVWAARKKAAPQTPLTERGQKLEALYAGQLEKLRAQIIKALPKIDGQRKAAFLKAYREEAAATAAHLNALRGQDRKPSGHSSKKVFEAAGEKLQRAKKSAAPPAKAMLARLQKFLAGDRLDGELAKCMVLAGATPRGLAEFAQQGKEHEKLIETLLADHRLMIQMAVARGAKDGKYGQAMKIYTGIQKASKKARRGVLKRLALAIGLEHAVPVSQRNPKSLTDAPTTVDPVQRYLHYEKAFLAGELDPGFKDLSVWECRNVVNGDEPDETLAWGREMLRNYRPDHITTDDYRWRYVATVKTDIRYGSQDNKYDKPELQFFQNILMNGGVCGRRAFFGRFILRSFGIPTVPRPQRGHAALAHWTPAGWVVCLGANWTWGWTPYGQDLDFLAHTQARENEDVFLEALRAKWVGAVLGEEAAFGFHSGASGFWNGVSLYRQRAIIEEAKAVALAAVGTDIGEANESKVKDAIKEVAMTGADRRIVVGGDGVITIPAAAASRPKKSTRKIIFMESILGGKQLHYSRTGKHEEFEYTFNAPKAGRYALTAQVVTPSWKQHLLVAANGAEEPVDITLPFTVGMWDTTDPVDVTLRKGKNMLRFSREGEVKGVTIKEFTLTPLRD